MFLFTVTKPGLRQAGALALCAVCLCGTVAAAVHFSGDAVAAAAPVTATVETTQDIGTYFTGYGFETDLSSAAVDKVKIPKKWDDSFTAFNQVVQESGLDLGSYKGKTVEKWTLLCPAAFHRRRGYLLRFAGVQNQTGRGVPAGEALRRGKRAGYGGEDRRGSRRRGDRIP